VQLEQALVCIANAIELATSRRRHRAVFQHGTSVSAAGTDRWSGGAIFRVTSSAIPLTRAGCRLRWFPGGALGYNTAC